MKTVDRSSPTPKIVAISIFLLVNCLYAFIGEKSRKTIKAIVHQRYVTLLPDVLLAMSNDPIFKVMFSHFRFFTYLCLILTNASLLILM